MCEVDEATRLYRLAIKYVQEDRFVECIDTIQEVTLLRGEMSPDMYRNMGWSHYRMGEQCLFRQEWNEALEHMEKTNHHYKQADIGFTAMSQEKHSDDFLSRIKHRILDCKKRVVHSAGFIECMNRGKKEGLAGESE